MSKEQLNSDIVQFVYQYGTLDPTDIQRAIPAASGYSSEEISNIIQEDYEKMNREVEYSVHPDYQGTCAE